MDDCVFLRARFTKEWPAVAFTVGEFPQSEFLRMKPNTRDLKI
jgi:hypothetical protein